MLAQPQIQTLPNPDASSVLLDAAASLERKWKDAEQRAQVLAQQVRWAEIRHERTRRWLLTLRASLRNSSHRSTTQLLKRLLLDLNGTGERL